MKNLIFKISICLFAFLMSYKAFAGDTIYSLPKVAYVEYATGFSKPTDIANAGDGRLFIVEAKGNIKIINANGTTNPTVFMKVPSVNSSGNEQGLLGLAFHPNYASNKQFYVNYIRGSGNGNTQISRFTTSSTNPDTASVSSKFDILTFPQPYANHNGGDLNFGPDGFLYIGTGDGGLANDPEENGQKKKSLLGKMLRIDINSGSPYSIPSTNPFAGNTDYLPEIWALGLRNPWRVSFDRQTGDLYIADVGQNLWEEVDFVPAGSAGGMNFGWDCWEGNHVLEPAGCGPMSSFQFPVFEYTHGSECSITGGFVYRGNNYPRMKGNYICADYCSGATYMLTKNTDATFKSRKFANIGNMITFGENNNGELFAGNENGKIYRVIDTCNNFFATKTIQQACSGVNGSIVLDIKGGTGAKTIVWSNGNTTTNNSNLIPGLYRLTISDTKGCQIIDSTTITSVTPEKPAIWYNMDANSVDCWTVGLSYQWFKDGIPYLIGGNPVISQNAPATTSGIYFVRITDANGCIIDSDPLTVTVSGILNQQVEIGTLSVFPNPSNGLFHLNFYGKNTYTTSIQILDIVGKINLEINLPNSNNQFEKDIDLSNYPTGIYIVKVKTTTGEISKRIFKQ